MLNSNLCGHSKTGARTTARRRTPETGSEGLHRNYEAAAGLAPPPFNKSCATAELLVCSENLEPPGTVEYRSMVGDG